MLVRSGVWQLCTVKPGQGWCLVTIYCEAWSRVVSGNYVLICWLGWCLVTMYWYADLMWCLATMFWYTDLRWFLATMYGVLVRDGVWQLSIDMLCGVLSGNYVLICWCGVVSDNYVLICRSGVLSDNLVLIGWSWGGVWQLCTGVLVTEYCLATIYWYVVWGDVWQLSITMLVWGIIDLLVHNSWPKWVLYYVD